MKTHRQITAILHIVLGALGLIAAFLVFVFFGIAGGIAFSEGEHAAASIVGILGLLVAGFLALLALPGIIGGLGLLAEKSWARILLIVVGALHLLNFPFGTVLGIYTLWALLSEDPRPVVRSHPGVSNIG
jgi:hypothetical protein